MSEKGNNLLSQIEMARAEISQLREQLATSAAEVEARDAVIRLLQQSRSWRVTAPLRALARALKLNSEPKAPAMIDDAEWFELQFDPAGAKAKYGIILPSFPDDATQISFTGMCGRPNLQQAFSFYLYVRSVSGIDKLPDPRVMDFGAGWGRIARLFLRT